MDVQFRLRTICQHCVKTSCLFEVGEDLTTKGLHLEKGCEQNNEWSYEKDNEQVLA